MTATLVLLAACSTPEKGVAPIEDRSVHTSRATTVGKGYYVVQKGDTLTQIARRHGHSTANLVAWNELTNANDIKIGQVLRVSPSTGKKSTAQNAQAAPVATASAVEVRKLDDTRTEKASNEDPKPAALDSKPKAAASDVNWMWPANGKIIRGYDGSKNKGIDIAGTADEKVLASADGKVIYTGSMKGYGNLVIIKHTDEMLSAYAHNKAIMVKQGAAVTRGQPVATMGKTDAEGIRLHFEIRKQGKPVDPTQYLPAR